MAASMNTELRVHKMRTVHLRVLVEISLHHYCISNYKQATSNNNKKNVFKPTLLNSDTVLTRQRQQKRSAQNYHNKSTDEA